MKHVFTFLALICLARLSAQNVHEDCAQAIADGDLEAVQEAFEKGAQVNFLDEEGKTFIMMAVDEDELEIAEYLLSKSGINCFVSDKEGKNVLHYLAESEDVISVFPKLLIQGAQVDAKDEEGNTPLMLAADDKNFAVCSLLVYNGARLDLTNEEEVSAVDIALDKGEEEVLNLFAEKTNDKAVGTSLLCYATSKTAIENLKKLAVDFNTPCTEDGETALSFALYDKNLELTGLLLNSGANPNTKLSDGTPLYFYVFNSESLLLFINAKADLTLTNKDGKSLLQEFVELYIGFPLNTGYDEGFNIIKTLIDSGYKMPSNFNGVSILKLIKEFQYEAPDGVTIKPDAAESFKKKNDVRKTELTNYFKSKGVK